MAERDALDPQAPPEELAEYIRTLPDGTDFSKGPVGQLARVLLTGKPGECDPAKYARVFDCVRQHPSSSRWMTYAAWAESINGRRRTKDADMGVLIQELDTLNKSAARSLPDSEEKFMLLGTVCFNLGILLRGLRQYTAAAHAQRQSSACYGLAGNVDKQRIGMFVAQVEEVSAAFVAGDAVAIRRGCEALVSARDYIRAASAVYPTWMVDDAVLHIGYVLMMGRLLGTFSDEYLSKYDDDFDEAQRSRFVTWAELFKAWWLFDQNAHHEVVGLVPTDQATSSSANTALAMRILIALSMREMGDVAGSRDLLHSVVAHTGSDGGIPIAVAKRLLGV